MSFTVEDGTVVDDANSYVTTAFADTYHSDRGNTAWAALTDAAKQSALIKATDYIDQNYTFKGYLVESDQSLQWPRTYVKKVGRTYPYDNTIPDRLKQAACILALESTSTDLNPVRERGGLVKREKVDVIEVEYMDGAGGATKRPAIDGLLRDFIAGSPLNAKAVRV